MNEINLNNDRFRSHIRSTLGNKFGEPYDSLVEEFFLREQYVLDLTLDELNEDINNFSNSVKSYSFTNNNYTQGYSWSGVNVGDRIEFNKNFFEQKARNLPKEAYYELFFLVFCHETLHGTQKDENGRIRAAGYNNILKNRNHAIYEICTEVTASKMVYNRNIQEFSCNNIIGSGYSEELFGVGILASAFGVSEREVLKYGVRQREKLVEALDKNIGNKKVTEEYINRLEQQLEYMHSTLYPDNNQKEFLNLTQNQKKEYCTNALKEMIKISHEIMATRIQGISSSYDKNVIVQLNNDKKKLEDTVANEIYKCGYIYKDNCAELIMALEWTNNARYVKESINVLDKIQQDRTGRLKNNAPYLISAVKNGNFQYCEDWGIPLLNQRNLTFSVSVGDNAFNANKQNVDFNNFKAWNSSRIFDILDNKISLNPVQPRKQIPLHYWRDLNTYEGNEKYANLKFALLETKRKYGAENQDVLFDFIENGSNFNSAKITRENNARDCFKRNFSSDTDRVYMAKLVAQKFVERTYKDDGRIKVVDGKRHGELQMYMKPTYQKYGKEALVLAITQLLVNDDYQSFSSEVSRKNLSFIGKKSIFETISRPLVDELLNQREIQSDKEIALKRTIYTTECKYPNQAADRISAIIDGYNFKKQIQVGYIPREQRMEFGNKFKSGEDLKDLVSILANEYARNYINSKNSNDYSRLNLTNNPNFNNIIDRDGADIFRENILEKAFNNNNISVKELISSLSRPFINETMITGELDKWYLDNRENVKINDLKPIGMVQRFSKFNNCVNNLVNAKNNFKMAEFEDGRS